MSARSVLITPRESSRTTSLMPAVSRISATAMPAAPAPETTTRSPSSSRPVTLAAPVRAARTTTAVPCWSSCMTGQSRASMSFSSSSKQRGAAMSSRLTAPKLGRSRTSVSTISSTSVVLRTSGMESSSPKALNRADLPSMTGREALGPMFPRPRTAVPSLTTATRRWAQVWVLASFGSAWMARLTSATPGVYAMERSRLLASGTVLAMESLPPSWAAKISWSVSAARLRSCRWGQSFQWTRRCLLG